MKFLVDAQLPKFLSDFLNNKSYDSVHTFDLPDKNESNDIHLIKTSVKQKRIIITKDNDFLESYIVNSLPPKLIIVKTGNIRNKELFNIFEKNIQTIIDLISKNNLLEISKTEIIEHE